MARVDVRLSYANAGDTNIDESGEAWEYVVYKVPRVIAEDRLARGMPPYGAWLPVHRVKFGSLDWQQEQISQEEMDFIKANTPVESPESIKAAVEGFNLRTANLKLKSA
jgi:hypothetical protein